MVRKVLVGLSLAAGIAACSGESTVIRHDGTAGDSANGASTGAGASGGSTGSGAGASGGNTGSGATGGSGALGGAGGSGSGGNDDDPVRGGSAGGSVPRGGAAGSVDLGEGGAIPVGGFGGNDPCAPPAVDVELGDWVPWEPGAGEDPARRIQAGMVGDWYGVVNTPWTSPYVVTLSFAEDLSYSGECAWASNQCCVAFYYGTDDDSELKRFELGGVTLDGTGFGDIDIVYGTPGSYYESGYQGTLEDIELDATLDRMRFDFMYGGTYGPLHFELERRGEAPPR